MNDSIKVIIPWNDLAAAISDNILHAFKGFQTAIPPQFETEEKYLTRKETADLLKISLPTLNDYTKKGKLIGYRLGSRVLYKESEIHANLQKIKV